jgi:GNAT superfamily N-acetyltransferase
VNLAADTLTYAEVDHVQTTTRVFAAFSGPLPLGALCVDAGLETVELVFVQDFARRRGIATALLEFARRETGLELDFDTGDRSPDGDGWARSVGLRCQKRNRLAQREADALGSRLMSQLYGWNG